MIPDILAGQSYVFPVMEGSILVHTRGVLSHSQGNSSRASCNTSGIEFDIRRLRLGAKSGSLVTLEMCKGLERETDIASSVGSHPHIVRCFGSLVENIGAEHCRLLLCDPCSCDLAEHLRIHGGLLPIDDVAELGEQLSLGLRHLHSLSILCGGVTTHGVLLGCDGKWKLLGDLSSAAVLPLHVTEWRRRLLSHTSEEHILLPPEVRPQIAEERGTHMMVSLALDIWMLGAMLAQIMEGVDGKCISNARSGNAVLAASQEILLCPFATRLWMMLHWLLAKDPSQRPSSRRLVDILHSLSEIAPHDLLIEMPEHARFHCEGMAMTSARKLAYSSLASVGSNRSCTVGLPLEILRMSMVDPSVVDQLYHNCGLELSHFPQTDASQPEVPSLVPLLCEPIREACCGDNECAQERNHARSISCSVWHPDMDESTDAGSTSGEESINVSDTDSAGDCCTANMDSPRIVGKRRSVKLTDYQIEQCC